MLILPQGEVRADEANQQLAVRAPDIPVRLERYSIGGRAAKQLRVGTLQRGLHRKRGPANRIVITDSRAVGGEVGFGCESTH